MQKKKKSSCDANTITAASVNRKALWTAKFLEGGAYSTVTDFARLRGWSTSVPMNTAVK